MNRRTDTKQQEGQGGRIPAPALLSTLALSLALLLAPPLGANEAKITVEDPVSFPVCYDFTCRTRETVTLSRSHWETVLELFDTAASSARDERLAIQAAVGRMEQLTGFHTPTYRDLAKNYTGEDGAVSQLPGQMDCVDESINTTTYLRVFEARGLLRYHRVLSRAYRRALLNQHWAGQVEDIATGERFVVDSWFYENGRQPYIVRSDDWHDIAPFRLPRAVARSSDQAALSTRER